MERDDLTPEVKTLDLSAQALMVVAGPEARRECLAIAGDGEGLTTSSRGRAVGLAEKGGDGGRWILDRVISLVHAILRAV